MARALTSLRAKWTLALLVVGVVPAAATAAASWRVLVRAVERSERELEAAVVDETTRALDETFAEGEDGAGRVARLLFADGVAPDARLELARAAFARETALDCLAVYDVDGAFVDALARDGAACAKLAEERPSPAAPTAADDEEGQGVGRWVVRASEAGLEAIHLRPVRAAGARVGAVGARLDGRALAERVRETSRARFGREEGIAVLDGEGRVLVGSLGAAEDAGPRLFTAFGVTPEALAAPFVATTQLRDPTSGEALVGTVRSLPARRWALVVQRPEAEAFESLGAAKRAFAWLAGAVVVAALAAGAALGARATRPVLDLVRLVRAFGARRWAERSPVRTGDELEELGHSLDDMATSLAASEVEIERRARVQADLSRYLPDAVAASIAASGGERELALGGERRRVSVVFADVVGFTTYAERAAPDDVARLLNELFGVLTEVVFRHGGVVDKFMGDCVMAVFGATNEPNDGDDHARRAIRAAADMHRFVDAMAGALEDRSGFRVQLAVGVSTGEALAGNLGSSRRMEFTVIGDAVNVASRLEQLARGGQTLAVAATVEDAKDEAAFRSLGPQPLRGKAEAVEIFELEEEPA